MKHESGGYKESTLATTIHNPNEQSTAVGTSTQECSPVVEEESKIDWDKVLHPSRKCSALTYIMEEAQEDS